MILPMMGERWFNDHDVGGENVAEGRIKNLNDNMFSLDEGADVGFDEASNVNSRYKLSNNHFTGKYTM